MSKLIFLVGISGSGKSTYKEEFVKNNPNVIVINRDSLRESLSGRKASLYNKRPIGRVENLINRIIDNILGDLDSDELTILVDNTNLKLTYIKDIISSFSPSPLDSIEYILIDTPIELAKQRVMQRDNLSYEEVKYIDKQEKDLTEKKKHITFDEVIKVPPLTFVNTKGERYLLYNNGTEEFLHTSIGGDSTSKLNN